MTLPRGRKKGYRTAFQDSNLQPASTPKPQYYKHSATPPPHFAAFKASDLQARYSFSQDRFDRLARNMTNFELMTEANCHANKSHWRIRVYGLFNFKQISCVPRNRHCHSPIVSVCSAVVQGRTWEKGDGGWGSWTGLGPGAGQNSRMCNMHQWPLLTYYKFHVLLYA